MIDAIETEDDYRKALNRFLQVCEPKTEEELWEKYQLLRLIEAYEEKNCRYD